MNIYKVARICHEANRAICQSMGDYSQPTWKEAPEWQVESTLSGIQNILDGKIASPQDAHNSWANHKLEQGWTYGPVKDPVAKTHPLLIPYKDLSPMDKVKDAVFFAIVKADMDSDAVGEPS